MLDHLKLNFHPKPHPESVVQVGPVRFTILTSQLIRLEFDPSETFQDQPTQIFWHRNLPLPKFEKLVDQEKIIIETDHLRLSYQIQDFGFYHRFLEIKIKGTSFTWHYGQENNTNLYGTVRTLDRADSAVPLNPGLIARTGWSLVDDSLSLVFTKDGWLEPHGRHPHAKDLYFFGYGHNYTQCIQDFQRLSGKIPILPRFALGNWWSRYWEYEQDELIALMQEFQDHQIPLSVCIVDMDWHIVNTGNESSGWTGYTWNSKLFPEPQRFLNELDEMGLKTALNLHPASGVYPHEAQYEEMAEQMGVGPESKKPIPFDIADPKFTKAYFEILHHPLEEMGVDFWWLDWQQGTKTKLAGLDPLFWLNHLHFYDRARDGKKRPFIFSRWGGLGSQRYPIGFSGDTFTTWEMLQFQPYFTATSANVAYGWWSHDIGGHMGGVKDPELYIRWLQYGVFSPIFRLHATKNPYLERRPWGFDAETTKKAGDAMRLRHALIPYLYTAAWRNHTEGILPIRPLYHLYPEENDAYLCPNEYTFGSELVTVPFTTPLDKDTNLSRQLVWLPKGDWFDFFTGDHFPGGGWHVIYGDLDKIPAFTRAGGIIPLGPYLGHHGVECPDALTVKVFPGATNTYQLYEDDGESLAYQKGAYALTKFTQAWEDNKLIFTIDPVAGEASLLSKDRIFKLIFHAVNRPDQVNADIAGEQIQLDQNYDQDKHQLIITDIILPVDKSLRIEISKGAALQYSEGSQRASMEKLLQSFRLDAEVKYQLFQKLDELLQNPMMLINFADRMKDTQLLALIETWIGKQDHRFPDDPREAFQQIIDQIYYQ